MRLVLKNIVIYGEGGSRMNLSLEAEYGFGGENRLETLALTYSSRRRECHLTVAVSSPGIILVGESIIGAISGIPLDELEPAKAPLALLECLEDKLGLILDREKYLPLLESFLKG